MRDTIEMAREAGLLTWLKPPEDVIERFKAFEALVRADERSIERKACAKVADDQWVRNPNVSGGDAIRARGEAT